MGGEQQLFASRCGTGSVFEWVAVPHRASAISAVGYGGHQHMWPSGTCHVVSVSEELNC